ncbi:formylglycine-generating enzyme family protein [Nocardia sp. NBC_00508]|uniref:formylglycine-generating enzyme family protein n=1 Tax=Nocardia sp. NBC_00508 TaxID=2975992 RepID=UPI002E80E5D7|nr:SUMF1/EgtB/PvdO family nonheme iron enzyme [Nocardia sp. NBC_00508]WUD68677.1 formylglycine-generating enzyme family protein [Nocardia sp. NBC_00508]
MISEATAAVGSPESHLDTIAACQHYPRSWFEDETPQHMVRLDAFAIDRTPVTNAMFAAFVEATGHVTAAERRGYGLVYGRDYWTTVSGICWRHPHPRLDAPRDRPNHPVVHVDHTDATTYAIWAGKRLPSEAEWEHSAHGPDWMAWPWGNTWDRARAVTAEYWAGIEIRDLATWKAWWQPHYESHGPAPATSEVGVLTNGRSPFGVLDMAGNVAEWTATPYLLYDRHRIYDPNYRAVADHGHFVVRGGGWKSFRWQTRTSERIAVSPEYSAPDLGFRCARDLN